MKNKEKAIIDGANAAYLGAPHEPRANVRNIFAVAQAVEATGRDCIVVIDETNRFVVPDTAELKRLLSNIPITSVPSGADTARIILDMAQQYDAVIVSNNTYAEYLEEYPWIEQRRIPIALIDGTVLLLEQKLKRAS